MRAAALWKCVSFPAIKLTVKSLRVSVDLTEWLICLL